MTQVAHVVTRMADEAPLRTMGYELVASRAAACAHIRSVDSIYWWQDEVVANIEWEMTLTCLVDDAEQLAKTVREHHPYQLPAVTISVVDVDSHYISWVRHNTRS